MSLIDQALRQTEKDKTRDSHLHLPADCFCSAENNFHLKKAQRTAFSILAIFSVLLVTALIIDRNIRTHTVYSLPAIEQTDIKTDHMTAAGNKTDKNRKTGKTTPSDTLHSQSDSSAAGNPAAASSKNDNGKKLNKIFTDTPLQKEKKALASGQISLEISSSSYLSVDAMNSAGLLYLEKGDYSQSRLFFAEALKYSPENSKFLNNIGLSFYLAGNNHKAEIFFKKALKINPDNVDTLVNLGIVFRKTRQYGKSAVTFRKALLINPDSPELLYNYAILLEDINQQQEAVFYFYKFLKTAPENLAPYTEKVKNHLQKINLNLRNTVSSEQSTSNSRLQKQQ